MADAQIEAAQLVFVAGMAMSDELAPAVSAAIEHPRHPDRHRRAVLVRERLQESAQGGIDRERARLVQQRAAFALEHRHRQPLAMAVARAEAQRAQFAGLAGAQLAQVRAVLAPTLRERQRGRAAVGDDALHAPRQRRVMRVQAVPEFALRGLFDEALPALFGAGVFAQAAGHARAVEFQQQQAAELGVQRRDQRFARRGGYRLALAVAQLADGAKLGCQSVQFGRDQAAQRCFETACVFDRRHVNAERGRGRRAAARRRGRQARPRDARVARCWS